MKKIIRVLMENQGFVGGVLFVMCLCSCSLLYPSIPWQRVEIPLDVTKTNSPVAWSFVLTGSNRYRFFIDFDADELERDDRKEFARLFGREWQSDGDPGVPLDLKVSTYYGRNCDEAKKLHGRWEVHEYVTRAHQNNEVVSSVRGRNVARVLDRGFIYYSTDPRKKTICMIVEVTRAAPELAKFQPHLVLEEFSRGMH